MVIGPFETEYECQCFITDATKYVTGLLSQPRLETQRNLWNSLAAFCDKYRRGILLDVYYQKEKEQKLRAISDQLQTVRSHLD